jgi:predicted N-acetyltransferase YhbS
MPIRPEQPTDHAAIEALLDICFGAERHTKTVYRFRENSAPIPALSFVVEEDKKIAATIRYWQVALPDGSTSLLLGPIAVKPARQSDGIGGKLMTYSLQKAKDMGYGSCLLVGDESYYSRFGFHRAVTRGLDLGGWVDESRFLGLEWQAGHLGGQKGLLRPYQSKTSS